MTLYRINSFTCKIKILSFPLTVHNRNILSFLVSSICCISILDYSASSVLSLLPPTPFLLPLKRPCSLSHPGTAISDPKFGVYIYIYAHNIGTHQNLIPPQSQISIRGKMYIGSKIQTFLPQTLHPPNRRYRVQAVQQRSTPTISLLG